MDIEILNSPDVSIELDHKTEAVVNFILSVYPDEFTVLPHCEEIREGVYKMEGYWLPRQENTSVHTECDGEDVIELLKEGYDLSKGIGHIHTHPNMNTNPSGTDEEEAKARAESSCGVSVSVIMNEKGSRFGHIVDYDKNMYITDVPVVVYYPFPTEEYEQYMFESMKGAKDYKDAKKMWKYTIDDYYNEFYGLTDDEKAEIVALIKERFEKPATKYKSSPRVYTDGWDDWSVAEYPRISSMTDQEFLDFEEDEEARRILSPVEYDEYIAVKYG